MFDFKDLSSAKDKAKDRDDKRENEADKAYNEAFELINKLKKSPAFDLDLLRKAADKLVVSITTKRNKAEAYISLANIFYVIDNVPTAIQYLKMARAINPELPEINKLQDLISSGHASGQAL